MPIYFRENAFSSDHVNRDYSAVYTPYKIDSCITLSCAYYVLDNTYKYGIAHFDIANVNL